MSVRSVLIVLNALAVAGLAVYAVLTLRRTPELKEPPNQSGPLTDEVLEGRRLERVLGWALLCAAVVAVALPLYWLREPDRQSEALDYFDEGSVERGAVLFANATSEVYDSAKSLQCANCHGGNGEGGSAPTTYIRPDGKTVKVNWSAPALNTALLRFSEDEVRQIITYGRPGTPMQPWGVEGGGPKNDQSVTDLVAYLESIQLSPEEAQAQAAEALTAAREQPAQQLADAEAALAEAQAALDEVEADPEANAAQRRDAQQAVEDAEAALAWARDWVERRRDVSDGQLLFEVSCARCHTKNWSIFDPTVFTPEEIGLGAPGGGGTVGFNLRDGATVRRFGEGGDGEDAQVEFVRTGSDANQPYGIGGIGSGRMPGFGSMLTDEQIQAIVEYERDRIDETGYTGTTSEEAP